MATEIPSDPGSHFMLWSELELKEFADKFVITSVESPEQGFSISQFSGSINRLNDDDFSRSPKASMRIYGVAGTIKLLAGTYLLVITSRTEVGTYLGFPVFRVTSMRFISCNKASKFLSSQEKRDEDYFETLLKIVESTPGLYYSYETDITVNMQRRCKMSKEWMSIPIWKQGDLRFFGTITCWRISLKTRISKEKKLDGFIIPLLQGNILTCNSVTHTFFHSGEMILKNSPVVIKVISRRCTRRLGTRMWRRGANLEGDTANFVETEQLLEFDGHISSLIQVRGSIPLLWEQIVDLSYKPQLSIISHENTSKVVKCHFDDIFRRYGGCIAVDLADKHGSESLLSDTYAEEMRKLPNVRYVSFDFHLYCGNGNLDNMTLLYNQISEDFEKQRYFLRDPEGKILEEQKGIIRSNCIDCLDRTNVTQTYLAQKSLNIQLQRLALLSSPECITMFNEDFEIFKTLWVENGNDISIEYTGTDAMKGDFVRYGKQTMTGIVKDGMSALSRYYLNNFQDGLRQDAIDLISGHYTVNIGSPSPSQSRGLESTTYLPVASALVVGGLTVTSITFNQAGRSSPYLSSVVFVGLTAGLMAAIRANGRQLCSRPRLCGLF